MCVVFQYLVFKFSWAFPPKDNSCFPHELVPLNKTKRRKLSWFPEDRNFPTCMSRCYKS
jgi:hypothetical protein